MISNNQTLEWLKHRTGIKKLDFYPNPCRVRALELNAKGRPFADVFGNKEIKGFVGFIDIVGFSKRTMGRSPSEMSAYLKPFLEGIINIAIRYGALVDKTIGDEIMFVFPDRKEDGGRSAFIDIRPFATAIVKLQKQLGNEYPFRLGLSYGSLFVDHIKGTEYSEWTIVGESVNLAKRLQNPDGIKPINGFAGAFGMLVKEIFGHNFEVALDAITGCGLELTCEVQPENAELFKGVSRTKYAILRPIP
ncbi:MAG TPA: adenylate/guanylate cyclase domain-containing protein [Sedimentisphaerales bacterium]